MQAARKSSVRFRERSELLDFLLDMKGIEDGRLRLIKANFLFELGRYLLHKIDGILKGFSIVEEIDVDILRENIARHLESQIQVLMEKCRRRDRFKLSLDIVPR